MPDDRIRKPTGALPQAGAPAAGSSAPAPREPRAAVVVPVRYRFESFIHFVETQSMNISRSGMFLLAGDPPTLPVGTMIDFELSLADGYALMRGRGEVARVSHSPRGVGVRFRELDEPSRKLLDRIVHINAQEGKQPTAPLDFQEAPCAASSLAVLKGATRISPGVRFTGRELTVQIN